MNRPGDGRYVLAFDGSRGLGSLFVLVAHFGFLQTGWVGVQFFFVLSGYLITSILITQQDRAPSLGAHLKVFYQRRMLRIFPSYFGYLAVCTATLLLFGKPGVLRRVWVYLVTYTYNIYLSLPGHPLERYFSHLWSLSAEEQFYLIWPFVIYFLRGRARAMAVVAVLVAVPMLRVAAHVYAGSHGVAPNALGQALYMGTVFQFDAFAAGAAIAVFRWERFTWAPRAFIIGASAALVYGLAAMWLYPEPVVQRVDAFSLVRQGLSLGFPVMMVPRAQYLWGYSLVNLLSVLLVITMTQSHWITRFLSTPVLVWMGRLSYTTYIIHLPIQAILQDHYRAPLHTLNGFLLMFPYIAIVVLLSHLSYKYYESWFLKLKDRIAAQPQRPPDRAAA
ncbi:MAG: acyltransferase [Gemmatimonadaceae bacterium]